MTIRSAEADDAERISRLLIDLSRRYVLPDLSDAGGRYFLGELAAVRMRERLESGYGFHVAEANPKLSGVIAMSSPTHIYYLFVDSPFQRRGLARRLLFAATKPWRESEASQPLTVNASRYAVQAYQKMGFQPIGGRQEHNGVAYYPMAMTSPADMGSLPD